MKRLSTIDGDLQETMLTSGGDLPSSQARRREIIDELVRTLAGLAEGLESRNGGSDEAVVRLIGVLRSMSESIATADDATFSAIIREAGLLIRAVRERQAYFSRFTVH
ncbi:hypothetical protein FHX15_005155 [Rhizobium sp. BK650]|uniref:hypothetical protein n=1 Tax=Rhizobium sp. BK650 TaxID=2586990 RepID=UPI001825E3E6|nr:hypothetical protein [Rhizobium sp. BK650]MBB3659886.1 hypothetical protein [Rhizobium sp. BK650]